MATFFEFATKVDRFSGVLTEEFADVAAKKVVDFGAERARVELARDLGPDRRFSGWAVPVDTVTRRVSPGVWALGPKGRSAGPWTVAESGRNPTGVPRSGRRNRRWNGRTAGKRTASRVIDAVERDAVKIADGHLAAVIRQHFGG